jgi:DNA-binding transcriptional regulator GbsR (MarR family)
VEEAVRDFIERIGLLAEAEGLPRIAGRILALLLLEEEPSSLDEVVEKLQVSKGSVSTNVRLLERFGIIERVSIPGDRRDYYQIGEDPWERMYVVARERQRRVLVAMEEGAQLLPPTRAAGRRRLRDWTGFYSFLLEQMEEKIEQWRKQNQSDHEAQGRGTTHVRR